MNLFSTFFYYLFDNSDNSKADNPNFDDVYRILDKGFIEPPEENVNFIINFAKSYQVMHDIKGNNIEVYMN